MTEQAVQGVGGSGDGTDDWPTAPANSSTASAPAEPNNSATPSGDWSAAATNSSTGAYRDPVPRQSYTPIRFRAQTLS